MTLKVTRLPTSSQRFDQQVLACARMIDSTVNRAAAQHTAHASMAALVQLLGCGLRAMHKHSSGRWAVWKVCLKLIRFTYTRRAGA